MTRDAGAPQRTPEDSDDVRPHAPVWSEGGSGDDDGSQNDEPRPDGVPTGRTPSDKAAQSRPHEAQGEAARETLGPAARGTDTKPGTRRWWIALAAILIVGLAAAGYYRSGHPGAKTAQPAQNPGVPVQVADAKTADVPVYLDSLGTVQALNTVTVRTRVEGQLINVAFTEGQMVRAGDLLVQIDPRPYQAALDQATAKKAQDEATLANTKLDLARTQQLGDYATRQSLDTQRANVGSQTAQIAYDEATIENARTQLDYATIRSPLTGRTGLRLIDQGNIVHPTDTGGIVEITQIEPIAVLFTAPEAQLREIGAAKRDGSVEVTALSSDGKTVLARGELVLINNTVDASSGTVRLKAQFDNGQDLLWPGLSVNTRLKLKTLKDATTVPDVAIQRGQDQLFVYVAKADGTAEKRNVKVGLFSEGMAVVEDGLRPGEKVVTSGQYRVTVGAKLAIKGGDENSKPPNGEASSEKTASN